MSAAPVTWCPPRHIGCRLSQQTEARHVQCSLKRCMMCMSTCMRGGNISRVPEAWVHRAVMELSLWVFCGTACQLVPAVTAWLLVMVLGDASNTNSHIHRRPAAENAGQP